MENPYAITPEQRNILDSFKCERLSGNKENLFRILFRFRSQKGCGLVNNLQHNGWQDDGAGKTAYYLVKDADDEVLMFFSLKCGVLFDPDFFQEFMSDYNQETMEIWRKFLTEEEIAQLGDACRKDPRRLWFDFLYAADQEAAETIRTIKLLIGKGRFTQMHQELSLHARISNEKKSEPNKKIIRVPESFSAIELVEFCANDITKDRWDKEKMGGNRMGETLFWYFIVPKMLQINSLIGSEYAFLFAADEKANGSLVHYYQTAFHFRNMTHLGTIKPGYDLGCFFLGSRLRTVPEEYRPADADPDEYNGLDAYQQDFLDNFNKQSEN